MGVLGGLQRAGVTADGVNFRLVVGRLQWGTVQNAGGVIPTQRMVIPSGANVVVGTLQARKTLGVTVSAVVTNDELSVIKGVVQVVAAGPIALGEKIKCADNGRVIGMSDIDGAGATMATSAAGAAFANQPANDGVTVVSDSAADTGATHTVTIIGTTNGSAGSLVEEVIQLDGVTPVPSVKLDWGKILAIKADAHAGTITVAEASGSATIKTLATGTNSSGVNLVAAASQSAFGLAPTVTGSDTTTKVVGAKYEAAAGTVAQLASVTLNNTTAVALPAANSVSEFYTGDVEGTRTVVLKTTATEEDENNCVGQALGPATAAGSVILADIR